MEPITEPVARKVRDLVRQGLSRGLGKQEPGQMCVEAAVCAALGLPHGDNPPCVGSAVRRHKIGINDANWSSRDARAKGMLAVAIAQLGSVEIDQVEFAKLIVEGGIRRVLPMALHAAATRADEKHARALEAAAQRCETEGTREAARNANRAAATARYAAAAARYAAADDAAAAADADAARYAADAAATAADAADHAAAAAATDDAAAAARYAAAAAAVATTAAADDDAAVRDKVLTVAADVCLQALIALKSPGCEFLYLIDEA